MSVAGIASFPDVDVWYRVVFSISSLMSIVNDTV